MQQDTGKFRTNTKDQFYTQDAVAAKCVSILLETFPELATEDYEWVEPSAGKGAFLKCVPSSKHRLGLDIDPQADGIQKQDFLEWVPPPSSSKRLFFGNPPFGRQGSTAKAFIKHAAKYGTILAFILPRSFEKPSMWRCFPPLFHCKKSCELDADSFEVNGVAYSVPCVFQIWVKQSEPRVDSPPIHEVGFHYGKKSDGYDIAFRRVGVYAGKAFVSDSGTGTYSEQSHYFLSLLPAFLPHKEKIVEAINAHTFPSNTTGPRSISKSEANAVINEILGGLVPEDAST